VGVKSSTEIGGGKIKILSKFIYFSCHHSHYMIIIVGIFNIVVFLNKEDQINNEELLKLVEFEVHEILSYYEFSGEKIFCSVSLCFNCKKLH
jgi:hypothetical protein